MDITGVFEVVAEIEEIGARQSDHLVVGEAEEWPVSLVRRLGHADARWAFSDRCTLALTHPDPASSSEWVSYRRRWLSARRRGHLWLME